MAAELGELKSQLEDAKAERTAAKERLTDAKSTLRRTQLEYQGRIQAAENRLEGAQKKPRQIRKDIKDLEVLRRALHKKQRRNETKRTKLDARIEKRRKDEGETKARIQEYKARLERSNQEGWRQLMLHPLLTVKIAYLERRSARTQQTVERLGKRTGQLDDSHRRMEDGQKDVENRLENKEREEQAAIEDVEKKHKEQDALTAERRQAEAQATNRIRNDSKSLADKRRGVETAARKVNREALRTPWKRATNRIVGLGKWLGFTGVAACVYVYAISLGAVYRSSYFGLNGINILHYVDPTDFLAPGYALAMIFTGVFAGIIVLVVLVMIPFCCLIKFLLTLKLPWYTEYVAAILPNVTKLISGGAVLGIFFVPPLFLGLGGAAVFGCYQAKLFPVSEDIVSIVAAPPLSQSREYLRIGSTSKYMFLKTREPAAAELASTERTWPDMICDQCSMLYKETLKLTSRIIPYRSSEAQRMAPEAEDGESGGDILIVPLSQITCIHETKGNIGGPCRSPGIVHETSTEHQHPGYVTTDQIREIDIRTKLLEGRISTVEKTVWRGSDTVGKGLEDISQAVGKIVDPERAQTVFEKDVVEKLGSIAGKLGQSNDGPRKDDDSETQSPEKCGEDPCATETLVDQHITEDMNCPPGQFDKSIFFSFVHDEGRVMEESSEQTPTSRKEWEEEIRKFVGDWNNKTKRRVYGFASLDGRSALNDDLSRQRAETVREMMCDVSETSGGIEGCQEKVEIRYLGENHLVTAGPKSRSAVIAVCVPALKQNPEKETTPAGEPGSSTG